jgi:hypothetical protein
VRVARQVLSTVVAHVVRGMAPPTFVCKGKTAGDFWGGPASGEVEMEFLSGYCLRGVLDKGQYGQYGLLNCVQVGIARPPQNKNLFRDPPQKKKYFSVEA